VSCKKTTKNVLISQTFEQVLLLKKKVRIYRKHVARLRQALSQRHLAAEDSNNLPAYEVTTTVEKLPHPAISWTAGEEQEDPFTKQGVNREGSRHKLKNGRQSSAVSEQYWADRKDFSSDFHTENLPIVANIRPFVLSFLL
jgi:hypothetical protein